MSKKITELTELTTEPADGDLIPIVDSSDTTDSANGTTKKITATKLVQLASTTVKGKVKLSTAPDSASEPIAVGANDIVSYAADSVGTDSYAITPSPAITAYATGQMFRFKAGTANTGACSLNVNGLGAKTIKKNVSDDLATGNILANQIVTVIYDGTNMQMVSSIPSAIPVVKTYLNAASPATWTKPAGLKYIIVEVQGGGANAVSLNYGGGGGGYSKKLITTAALGATETVTIGAAQGNSSFGSHAVGNGATNQSGGSASSGDINISGENGGTALAGFFESTGRSNTRSARGGSSVLGFGGNADLTNGGNGVLYGGGGACAGGSGSGNTAGNNGSGSAGIVIVTEYF